MIWSELMTKVRHSGLPRADLARHFAVEESDLVTLERADEYVEGDVQAHVLLLAHQYQRARFIASGESAPC